MFAAKKLMSKNGVVAVLLAREFISRLPADRIQTVGAYAKRFKTGRGTVQAALKLLQEEGAVTLESRGHLGTFITDLDYQMLWKLAGLGSMRGVMPLPYCKRYEGLATGLYKAFEAAALPFNLAFMRGAHKRAEALAAGDYDFAVTSELAAGYERRQFGNLEILRLFGVGSYVGGHKIIFRDSLRHKLEAGMRVGIDRYSPDQFLLTKYECEGIEVEYVETSYNQILNKLNSGQIDAAVWNKDEILEKRLNYTMGGLSNPQSVEVSAQAARAVLLVSRERAEIKTVLLRSLKCGTVEETQAEVLSGRLIPKY